MSYEFVKLSLELKKTDGWNIKNTSIQNTVTDIDRQTEKIRKEHEITVVCCYRAETY